MRQIAGEFASLGVTEIARTIAELLAWKRPNGGLKNHECRQLLERLERARAGPPAPVHRQQQPVPDPALGASEGAGQQDPGPLRPPTASGLAAPLWLPAAVAGNAGGCPALRRNLLPGGELDPAGRNPGARPDGSASPSRWLSTQAGLRLSPLPKRAATAPPGLPAVLRGSPAQRRLGLTRPSEAVNNYELPDEQFDVVAMIDLLHHVSPLHQRAAVEAALDRVKYGGVLLFKDIPPRPLPQALANRLHDLVVSREWVHYVPGDNTQRWGAARGFSLEHREIIHRLWYAHDLVVLRRQQRTASPGVSAGDA